MTSHADEIIKKLSKDVKVSTEILKKNLLGRQGVSLIENGVIPYETLLCVAQMWARAGQPDIIKPRIKYVEQLTSSVDDKTGS